MAQESRLAIIIDSRNARQQIDELRNSLNGLQNSGGQATVGVNGLGTAARAAAGALAGIGVGRLTSGLLQMTDRFKTMSGQIALVTSSTSEAARVFEILKNTANETGSSLESTVTLFTRMSNATRGAGFSQEQLLKVTDAVNKAFIVSSATQQEAAAASIQLSQAMASGVLRGEELNSVMEQAPRITRALSEYLGVTNGQIRAMAAEGKITSEVVANALLKSLESLNKEVATMPLRFERAAEVMKNNFLAAIGQVNVDPAIDAMKSLGDAFASPEIITNLNKLASSLSSIAGVGVQGFQAVISNIDALIALTGAYAASVGVKLVSSLGLATQARLADFAATMQQATATRAASLADVQAAQINTRRAIADKQQAGATLARANAELFATRSSRASRFALDAQTAAASANRTATLALTEAKIAQTAAEATLTATATRGAAARTAAFAAVGGPIGLATLAVAGLVGGMIYLGSGTDAATKALIDQNMTLDESIDKFKKLSAEQQRFQSATWIEAQREATTEADKALASYYTRAFDGLTALGASGVGAKDSLKEMYAEVKSGQRSLDSLTSWLTNNTQIQGMYSSELIRLAATYSETSQKAADYGGLLGRSTEASNGAAAAARSLVASQAGVGSAVSSNAKEWDKYIAQLTQTRDLIGANTAQEAAYSAAKAGFNTQQVEYSRLIGQQVDLLKKYEEAVKAGKKEDQDRLKVQLTASLTASDALKAQMESQGRSMKQMAENAESSAKRQVDAIQTVIDQTVRYAKGLSLVETYQPKESRSGASLLTFGQEQPKQQAVEIAKVKTVAERVKALTDQVLGNTDAKTSKSKAESGLNSKISAAATAFDNLYKAAQPAKFALQEYVEKQGQLELLLSKGKITQQQYNEALAQSSINYAAAIKGAQGLTQAEQYRAQLEKQLNTQRTQYSLEAAGVGMGDQQTARLQQRVQLEQQTNDRILQLRTELANATTEKQRQDLQAQIDLTEEFLPKQVQAMQAGWIQMDQAVLNASNGWTAALQNFQVSANDIAGQTQSMFSNAFQDISAGAGRAFEGMIFDGMTFGDAMSMITENVLRGVVSALGEMAARWAVNAALNATLGASAAATNIALAGTTATAWAPAAAMASLATLGANAVPAAAALTSTTALSAGLAIVPGFATGGHVSGPGSGTSDSIPARLSNGEFVVNAQATKRNRALLEAINSNERVSVRGGGGGVSAQSNGSSGSGGGSSGGGGDLNIPIQVTVQAQPGMSEAEARRQGQQAGEGVRDIVRQVIQQEQRPGGMLA